MSAARHAGLVLAALSLLVQDAAAQPNGAPDPQVRAVIAPGAPAPPPPPSAPADRLRPGDVTLNFPNVDVAVAAKAVLGDILGLQYSVGPTLHVPVSVVTQRPIARADVLRFFEAALSNAQLALVRRDGVYAILPQAEALAQAPVTGAADERPGFASEAVGLNFVNADELKKLIDPVLPNVVVQADPSRNVLMIAGTPGQRAAARDLIRQFDVNWLRNTSFALFVPQRTDARLIVPELDKMINEPASPAHGLVKLIAMDRLNGILAVSSQPQYLEDVRRWIEIMDREGQNNERRIFVYRVQNGRSADLARTLASAFGARTSGGSGDRGSTVTRDDLNLRPGEMGGPGGAGGAPAPMPGAFGGPQANAAGAAGLNAADLQLPNRPSGGSVDIAVDDLHARISSDDSNNAIVVYATPRDYAVIEDALRKLDVTPSEVMIEAAIVEVTLTDKLAYGVQWAFSSNHGNGGGLLTEGATAAVAPAYPGFSYTIPLAKGVNATLDALENLTKIRVISSPKLMVLNNQTASLEVGDQVPILTGSAVSTIGSNAPIVNSVDYRDTGIILKITPRVNSSGLVLLDLAQEVSGVVNAQTTAGVNSPTISTRRIATSVAVQDGQTLALGGLFSSSRTDGKNGVPYLTRIPVLGALFGDHEGDHERTELIVLLRPKVVRTVDEGQAVTEDLKAKLETLKPLWAERPQP